MLQLLACVQVLSVKAPSADVRSQWWQAFYQGAAFRTFARVLLLGTFLTSNFCVLLNFPIVFSKLWLRLVLVCIPYIFMAVKFEIF